MTAFVARSRAYFHWVQGHRVIRGYWIFGRRVSFRCVTCGVEIDA